MINKNQSLVPFLGDRLSFVGGLDPLGLQNTSEAIFSTLLPGLNNVTGRIRYYSFYCWLLDSYSDIIGSTDPLEQKRFIRKAEYVIALSSQFYEGDASSIPGSNYASRVLQEADVYSFNLKSGIENEDGTTTDTYWKFGLGAFGQYYQGALRDIGLIVERENQSKLYARTNPTEENGVSGAQLAEAFRKSLDSEIEAFFFASIESENVSRDDLELFSKGIALNQIPTDSDEQNLLIELLLAKDQSRAIEETPTTFRKSTIQLLLDWIEKSNAQISDRNFVEYAYNVKGLIGTEVNATLFGWYYYHFNELWQFANTSILNGVLARLERNFGPNWVSVASFIDEISKEVEEAFIQKRIVHSGLSTLSECVEKNILMESECLEKIKSSEQVEKVVNAFQLLLTLYKNNKQELTELQSFGQHNEMERDGEASNYFRTEFKFKAALPLRDFIRDYLFKHILMRHQFVALRKMGGGTQSTQKFLLEDHRMRYLSNFDASFTGPRIGNLISFLRDLNIISEENILSPHGKQLLQELKEIAD